MLDHVLSFFGGFIAGILTLLTVVALGIFPDVQYTLRNYFLDRHPNAIKPTSANVVSESKHTVLPSSIDRNGHMNNSMYIYELNFARKKLFNALGIWDVMEKHAANMVIQAQTIRYRRELKLWQQYRILSRIVTWDDEKKVFYIESKFVSRSDGFILAIHHAKYKVISSQKCAVSLTPSAILLEANLMYDSNSQEAFITFWENANDISSKELNPKKN